MLSKACIVGIYQRKLELIARHNIDLLTLVPPSWRDERGEMRLERAYTEGYRLETVPIRLNGNFHLHFYGGLAAHMRQFQPHIVHIDGVSSAMLGEAIPTALPTRLVVAVDAFGFADANVAAALQPMVKRLAALVGASREEVMAPPGLSVWARAQRTLQPVEAYDTFKAWLDERNPRFAFSVAKALVMGSLVPPAEQAWAQLMRQEVRARMAYLLPAGTILCLPTTPFPAPPVGQPLSVLDPLRDRITCLCAQGGHAGHPQVSLPGAAVDGLPVGLSIIGPRGGDASLVAVAQAMEAAR
jgi:amidase